THYHQPGQKKANAYGLFDMHGNVLELTLDGYVEDRKKHFGKGDVHNPWVKATKPYPHVTKGGHWKHPLEKIISSARIPSHPNWKKTDPQGPKSIWAFSDAPFLGFRVVRPIKIPSAEELYHYWNSGTEFDGEMAVGP
ncbi:formylglycine-generating enzyme family protein, partial [Akkermansiaceae bacterium]|nr:formylglycine-generating enzyme family protein [Akkermansiaceae bacterium]